jgi:release factor glutamine methyltransferase
VNLRDALQQGQKLLEDASIGAPRLTAEVLLAHALGCDRTWLYAHATDELREVWWIHFGRYLHERMQGKPTQYITGRQEFFGREFRVTPDVLIPRPETEHLIEAALGLSRNAATILDVGTGSGAIAVTLASELPEARVVATDISEAALRVAASNAQSLGAQVVFVACDLASAISGSFDLIVSNPPYIPRDDAPTIQREVRDFEPEVALYGGADGLEIYHRLTPEAARLLKPGGWLMMELGHNSSEVVRTMFDARWTEIELIADLAGWPRVIVAKLER